MAISQNNALDFQDASFDVERMALYSLERAQRTLDHLSEKKVVWDPEDTASFECMHYLGDTALEVCATTLNLKPGDHVLDIGSGFNATGRFLNRHHGIAVTGIELQPQIHEMAEIITAHTGQGAAVHSVNADFITAAKEAIPDESADHIISFLCMLHIPDRAKLFERAARTLHRGGQIYIEDFFAAKHPLPDADAQALRDIVSCPYLPSRTRYEQDLRDAGFVDIRFEDMSEPWSTFVGKRAMEYHASVEREESLDTFYATVAGLFARGNVGGARIWARKGV